MLRDEIEFKTRMRNSLRGIEHLDPETIPARLVALDVEIRQLAARVAGEMPPACLDMVPAGAVAEIRAA